MSGPPPAIDRERLLEALAELRPLERAVLFLSLEDGLSGEDVAVRLGISARRAERLLAGALATLDRALAPDQRPWWRFW